MLTTIGSGISLSNKHNLRNNNSKQRLMKKTLLTLALTVATVAAFAQGKINMVNDANHYLVYQNLKAVDAAMNGQPVTIAALPSGATFLVDLYGGADAGSMVLQTTTTINAAIPGGFGPLNFISANVAGGATGTFQIQVRESTFTTAALAQAGGGYFGFSPIFTMRPSSTIAYNSIVNAGGTALSTWAVGTVGTGLPIPEPSSMVLAGLGAASLLLFRRRK
jgi:hypothetical protein